ncbi:MAG TPA: PRK06851 family protein [Clostridia bacterium]|nr:PRK06851 family protein [Clostridia bacterium]
MAHKLTHGRLKKLFPGGNTCKGFISFYDYIIEPDANKIFVIKGGPGAGKSTFMRKIGEEMLARGYDVEFHCCASDNTSLDGVVINDIKVALVDGTAPHIVEPRNPGVVGDIIYLGEHWDESALHEYKREIMACSKEGARLYKHAYSYLAAANLFLENVRSYYRNTGALDVAGLDRQILDITHEVFAGKPRPNHKPKARHLFATAITPYGPISHLESIVGHLDKRYIIDGDDGTGKTTIARRLLEAALMRGYDVEAYHCALNPDQVEHLVIPGLSVGIINGVEPHFYLPKDGDTVIDTMQWVDVSLDKTYLSEKNTARMMYWQSFDQAVKFLAKAKEKHDEMEGYYIPHMRFNEINKRRDWVLKYVLELADRVKSQA